MEVSCIRGNSAGSVVEFFLFTFLAAGLLQMRYIYSMPVERIIKYFADNGFTLRKATANKLIARSADVLETSIRLFAK